MPDSAEVETENTIKGTAAMSIDDANGANGDADVDMNTSGDPDSSEDDALPDPTDPDEEEVDEATLEALSSSLMEELTRIKDEGNAHFKKGENELAIGVYESGLKAAAERATKPKVKETVKPVLISLNSNMAAASLRLEKWEATVAAASAALELDPQNSKALFRRGSARSKLGQLASAKDDLLSACRADPKDRNARAELEAVTERLKAQKAEEKATFAQKYQATAEKAVAKEEAREAARKREEARQKSLVEEGLRQEWRKECARLREEQRQQREEARQARLRKFLGEKIDGDSGAAESSAAAGSAAAPTKDLTRWAKGELRSRLGNLENLEHDGAYVGLELGITGVTGAASMTEVPASGGSGGVTPVHDFDFAFDVPFTVMTKEEAKVIGGGTLKYSGVQPLSLGSSDPSVDVGSVSEELKPPVGDTDEAKLATEAQTKGCVELLKTAIENALNDFNSALRMRQGGEEGDAEADGGDLAAGNANLAAFAAGGGFGAVGSAAMAAAAGADADVDAPISFEQWKKEKEEKDKAEKEAREKAEKEAKDAAAEERRRARKAEKIELKNDEDLKGFQKGYKVRADGSKTSYFDRSHVIDAQTKALLDAQKAPKRLSVGKAEPTEAEAEGSKAGSAWNTGGTWEEKDQSAWAKETLEEQLKPLTADAEDGGVRASVTKVKDVDGTASVVATRGTLRHLFELKFGLEFKLTKLEEGSEEGKSLCKGSLTYHDVMPSKTGGSVEVGDVELSYKSQPSDKDAAAAAVDALKRVVETRLAEFDSTFRATKKV